MAKTLQGGPWDYLPVLNECIKILLTILIGILASHFRAFDAETFVPHAVQFVFKVRLLPGANRKVFRYRASY